MLAGGMGPEQMSSGLPGSSARRSLGGLAPGVATAQGTLWGLLLWAVVLWAFTLHLAAFSPNARSVPLPECWGLAHTAAPPGNETVPWCQEQLVFIQVQRYQ